MVNNSINCVQVNQFLLSLHFNINFFIYLLWSIA